MLTLEQLNALRGISSSVAKKPAVTQTSSGKPNSGAINTAAPTFSQPQAQYVQQEQNTQQPAQTGNIPPVEIPCKNYADVKGHFAYIDANTHQISHVNLDTGQTYTLEEVYEMNLRHAVSVLSEEYQKLTWQQVMSENTVFDRFGSPIFAFEELSTAVAKAKEVAADNKPKTDPFGFPL